MYLHGENKVLKAIKVFQKKCFDGLLVVRMIPGDPKKKNVCEGTQESIQLFSKFEQWKTTEILLENYFNCFQWSELHLRSKVLIDVYDIGG